MSAFVACQIVIDHHIWDDVGNETCRMQSLKICRILTHRVLGMPARKAGRLCCRNLGCMLESMAVTVRRSTHASAYVYVDTSRYNSTDVQKFQPVDVCWTTLNPTRGVHVWWRTRALFPVASVRCEIGTHSSLLKVHWCTSEQTHSSWRLR